MFNQRKFISALIIALFVVGLGATSALAEQAIPGDFLYKFKIAVNERAAGIFSFTKEEKTEWKERMVERRLEEAQKLVSKNNLDEAKRVYLAEKIKTQVADFNTNINELALEKGESVNSSDLNIRLQASLSAYSSVLQTLKDEKNTGDNTKTETEKLLTTIADANTQVKNDHKNLETPSDSSSTSAINKQQVAENLLNSAKLHYQKIKVNLSTNIQSQIDNMLASAEVNQDDGSALMDAKDYANAQSSFEVVISRVNEAKLLMLSNVIKNNIEDDMGTDNHRGDIGGSDEFENEQADD